MKSYKEMADIIFERRDEYVQKQKAKKRAVAVCVTSAVFGCVVLLVSFMLWKNGKNGMDIPADTPSTTLNGETDTTTFHGSTPSTTPPTSQPSTDHSNDTPSTSEPSTPSSGTTEHPPTSEPSSPTEPEEFYIDSIDKLNFYSAKKIISETSLLPFRMNRMSSTASNVRLLNNLYVEYPIDRDRVFTVTMVTYFMIELHNENGFLAQKLGGTGLVEVVVTQNDLEEFGQIITFKRGDRYYSCLLNGGKYDPHSNKMSRRFSSCKYIEGFHIVKNKVQENYTFTVHYEGTQVVGFECTPEDSASPEKTDSSLFIEDFCVVLFTKQYVTIDQLEQYFINENKEDTL